ncbi:MAG: hypothetical protein AB4372_07615 [Xenococcus sp. (in: cyanobacteria)]
MENLKFKLDKAHQIYFECGKKKGTTFALVVIFFGLAALAVFSENIGNEITVPILHLKLNKLDAGVVFLLAGAVSLYRFSCFSYLLRL